MSDPSLALQVAIVAALRATPALCDGRVYDHVPEKASFPYVSLGEAEVLGDDNVCWAASDITMRVHVWSREPGFPEAKAIAGQVRGRCVVEFPLTGFAVTSAELVQIRHLRDPDGLTSHAVVELRYLVDHDT